MRCVFTSWTIEEFWNEWINIYTLNQRSLCWFRRGKKECSNEKGVPVYVRMFGTCIWFLIHIQQLIRFVLESNIFIRVCFVLEYRSHLSTLKSTVHVGASNVFTYKHDFGHITTRLQKVSVDGGREEYTFCAISLLLYSRYMYLHYTQKQ